ncbi:MAG: formate/nitrite transporter family protein [Acidiferrobacterales bacterium]
MAKKKESLLSSSERKDAQRRSAPGVAVVFEAIRQEAETELSRPNLALFWSGLAAGLSMGFSFHAEALLQSGLPDAPWQNLVSKLGYSVGFLIVILGRQQLFTENTLTPVLQVLRVKNRSALVNTGRLWAVVLGANLVGTFLFALALSTTSIADMREAAALETIAKHALAGGFGTTLVQAVVAGWLIALMVWLLPAAETARLTVIVIITYLVGISGFPHIIAGSTEMFYALLTGAVSPATAVGQFFLPTLIGNTIGGVALVAAINYAQVYPHAD